MLTREEYLRAADEAAKQGGLDAATFNATMAVALGQNEFLTVMAAMREQGPPQVGGTRMMTCHNNIGQDACKGGVSEQLYVITHQSLGNSTFRYQCLKCGHLTDVKRVATASLPADLQPARRDPGNRQLNHWHDRNPWQEDDSVVLLPPYLSSSFD